MLTWQVSRDKLRWPISDLGCCGERGVSPYMPLPAASLVAQIVENLPALGETQVRSLGRKDLLEKGMAAHSSILARRIPWTEGPGGLQSMGSQRVGQARAPNTFTAPPLFSVLFLCAFSPSGKTPPRSAYPIPGRPSHLPTAASKLGFSGARGRLDSLPGASRCGTGSRLASFLASASAKLFLASRRAGRTAGSAARVNFCGSKMSRTEKEILWWEGAALAPPSCHASMPQRPAARGPGW